MLAGDRFVREHDAHGSSEVYVDMAALKSLDDAADDSSFFVVPLFEYRIPLRLAKFLENNLFCRLGGNPAEVFTGFKRERHFISKFRLRVDFFRIGEKYVPFLVVARKFYLFLVDWFGVDFFIFLALLFNEPNRCFINDGFETRESKRAGFKVQF